MDQTSIKIAKRELRKTLSSKRPQSSEGLTQNLMNLSDALGPRLIATYHPLDSEPDVTKFNSWAKSRGIAVVFPRILGEGLEFATGEFTAGKFGIPSPLGQSIMLDQIELILVPGLAVDFSGNRLGKGLGFYDRILENLYCPKYGVVFENEVFSSIPSENHDQKLTGAVTPKSIREFSSADTV